MCEKCFCSNVPENTDSPTCSPVFSGERFLAQPFYHFTDGALPPAANIRRQHRELGNGGVLSSSVISSCFFPSLGSCRHVASTPSIWSQCESPARCLRALSLLVTFHSAYYRGVFMTEINQPLPFTKPLRFIYLGYTPLSASQRNFGQLRRLC